jgi:SAGA-associated factor 11
MNVTPHIKWIMASSRPSSSPSSPPQQQQHAQDILSFILDETCTDIAFEMHRSVKAYRVLECDEPLQVSGYHAPDSFDCTNCGRSVSAVRYAPHLSKCMGNGRRATRSKQNTDYVEPPRKKPKLPASPPPVLTSKPVDAVWQRSRGAGIRKRPLPAVLCCAINQSTGRPCQNSINCQKHTREQQEYGKTLLGNAWGWCTPISWTANIK